MWSLLALSLSFLAQAEPLHGNFVRTKVSCGYYEVTRLDRVTETRFHFGLNGDVAVEMSERGGCRALRWGTYETYAELVTLHLTGGCATCPDHPVPLPEEYFASNATAGFGVIGEDLLLLRRDGRFDRDLCPSRHVLSRRFHRVGDPRGRDELIGEVCGKSSGERPPAP